MNLRLPKRTAAAPPVSADPGGAAPAELRAQRDRLREQFALMQSELGGLFYEMAVRDHLRLELLVARAAALQQVDLELAGVQLRLDAAVGGA